MWKINIISDPSSAPESISKAVATLPPEQMFLLMKQMKDCIQQNPEDARTMLLKNPQLSYALVQALVVMRYFTFNNTIFNCDVSAAIRCNMLADQTTI